MFCGKTNVKTYDRIGGQKINIKKKIATAGLCVIIGVSSFGIGLLNIYASGHGNNVKAQDYKGVILKYRNNTTLDSAYRDTNSAVVPFSVRLDESDEPTKDGKKTITRFWLEDKNFDNISKTIDVTLKEGFYKTNPYSEANKKTVFLTAENNNYNANMYNIKGKWKEE
ncbi:DUF2712 domain-containing protein [uncultured Eubacterium sp.]|uniref:DUF2712 domain-containing protein n=1 Tax=uncultured Eubacterium sp. TaxID=165185 RepID=UPI00259673EC|nr:DUF2712 domain-containing protein [uncultured Eubacterium sp.]